MKILKVNILHNFLSVLLICLTSLLAVEANAEDGAVSFSNNAFKQVISKNSDGTVKYDYVEPKLVLPDDVILYEIIFENITQQDISNIVVNNPIANNSTYRESSASGDSTEITFSVDGENFSSAETLTVKGAAGVAIKAKPENYTAIRWVYKKTLKPGDKGKVTYKTTIK
ncbi:MAG: hypothetical protein GQ572_07215 [Gammaproteobacteria bacterium]|nr:hypothetical protein [Gammaproteobacteria bacterium]